MKRFIIRFILVILLGTLFFAETGQTRPRAILGKVSIRVGDKYGFQSSGFLAKYGNRSFFITANHTILNIEKTYGKNFPIFVHLPYVRRELFKSRIIFTEPFEDAAVLDLDNLIIEGDIGISFGSPFSLKKGENVLFMGYSGHNYDQIEPDSITGDFISEASESYDLHFMHLPPDLKEDERLVFLCGGGIPSEGFSGSPVFKHGSNVVIGIFSGSGSDSKDPRISELLGVKKYSVFFPLHRTLKRIDEQN
jgi:hypothetical protein